MSPSRLLAPRNIVPLLGVVAVALVLALRGLHGRDLMGDEVAMLSGDLGSILAGSLDPRREFTGHLPLSFSLRRGVLLLVGSDTAWAWRLVSALAYVLTPLVLWAPAVRAGRSGLALALGLAIAASPVLLFHAHDAGNYALTGLLGASLLRGLADVEDGVPRGLWWLAAGLALGALTDLFLGLLGLVIVGWVLVRRARGVRLAGLNGAALVVALPTVPVGLLLAARVLGSGTGEVVGAHAEGVAPTSLPAVLDVPLRVLVRVCGAFLEGYDSGRNLDPWVAAPAVLWTLAAAVVVGLAWRRGRSSGLARGALMLVVGVLGGAVIFGLIFRLLLGRTLPYEPRHLVGLGPSLVVLWVCAVGAMPPWPRRMLGCLLGASLALASWPIISEQGALVQEASRVVAADWRSGDRAVGTERFEVRLREAGVRSEVEPCLREAPLGRTWWLATGSPQDDAIWCEDAVRSEVYVDREWVLQPSAHERNSASFQPVRRLRLVVSGTPRGLPAHLPVHFEQALWSGLSGSVLLLRGEAGERVLELPAEGAVLDLPPDGLGAIQPVLTHSAATTAPRPGLLKPFRRELQTWEPRVLRPGDEALTLELAPLASPWLQVSRRLLLLLGALGMLLLGVVPGERWSRIARRGWGSRHAHAGEQGLLGATSGPGPAPPPEPLAPVRFDHQALAPRLAALTGCLVVLGLVLRRVLDHPVEAYGDSAAGWIEHLALLRSIEDWHNASGGPIDHLLAVDHLYPPLLHLLTAPAMVLGGYDPVVAVLSMLPWLGLLAASGAVIARTWGGPGWPVAAAVVLTPALHAVAARYYYDLPMTALLWASVAVVLWTGTRGRPSSLRWGGGVLAGALLAAASFVKWSSLPFGTIMLLALGAQAWRGRTGRGELARLALVAATWGILAGGFLALGATSFGAMGAATFQLPPGTDESWLALRESLPGGDRLVPMVVNALALDGARLAFYPWRLATSIFAPALSPLVLLGLVGWVRGGAPGRWLVGVVVLGQVGFLLLAVPPQDERFLLTPLPALVLAATWGLGRLPRAGWFLGLGLGLALLVAADFHLGQPRSEGEGLSRAVDIGRRGHLWRPRLGLSSSVERRGWARADDRRPDRALLRMALWEALEHCDAAVIGSPDPLIDPWGDQNWLSARAARVRARAGWATPRAEERRMVLVDGRSPPPERPELRLTAEPLDHWELSAEAPRVPPWGKVGTVVDPEGGPGVTIWQRRSEPRCEGWPR